MSGGELEGNVRLGSGAEVSAQVVQDMYNTLTGKTETIRQSYYDHYRVSVADLENLHRGLLQTLEQYHCPPPVLTITVRYSGGKAERFSGFDRFKLHALERNVATRSVEFEYSFLITLPQTREPKPYRVTIGVHNTIVELSELRKSLPPDPVFESILIGRGLTGRSEVQYVDVAVARTLEAQSADWFGSLKKVNSRLGEMSSRTAPYLDLLLRTLMFLGAAYGLSFFLEGSYESYEDLFRLVVLALFVFAVVRLLAFEIGTRTERWMRTVGGQSAVILSERDKAEVSAHDRAPFKAWLKTALSGVMAVTCSVFAAMVARWLGL